jgi:hypothetical protein
MNRSQIDAAAAIARAEAEPRPHTSDLAVCLWCAKMQMAEYDRRAAICGAHWTAARLRFVTLQLHAIINGKSIPINCIVSERELRGMMATNAADATV